MPRMTPLATAVAASSLLLLDLGTAQSVHAQESFILEEVIVTARKRSENLQQVPLSITAMNEQLLEERSINGLQDIADFTPGFDFAQAFGRSDFRPAIRGQSTILGGANASLYVDGIFIGRGGPTFPMAAIERVEVVKGPQSALYGRRALSGAINYVLKSPGEETSGSISAELGEDDLARYDLTLSGPLSDTVGYMVSLSHYSRDGQYDNGFAGNGVGAPARDDKIGGQETNSFIGALTFRPSDAVDITARVMWEESDDDSYGLGLLASSNNNCFRPGVDLDASGAPLAQPLPPAGTPEASANIVGSAGYNGSGYYCGEVDINDTLVNGRTNLETGFYDDMGTEDEYLRLGLTMNFDLNDAWTLTSNTGFNQNESESRLDQTNGGGDTFQTVLGLGSPFAVWPINSAVAPPETRIGFILDERDEFEELSQEFRLAFDNEGKVRFMLGAYYYQSEDTNNTQITSADTRQATVPGSGIPIFSPFDPTFTPSPQSFSPVYEGAAATELADREVTNWAVFGSVEYDITDRLTAGLELRYNEDEVEVSGGPENIDFSETYDAVLPRFTVDFQASDNLLLYAVYAEGNKPGSINSNEGLPEADRAIDEETATTYELGLKSQWLDGRLIANLSAYFIDWEDQQLTQTRSAVVNNQPRTFSILDNVGESEIQGIELELHSQLTDFWDLSLAYALTDSEVKSFVQSVDAGASAPSSFREAAIPSATRQTVM